MYKSLTAITLLPLNLMYMLYVIFCLQLLVQISIDLVLCLLSLLMSETPMAISHLLKAVSSLHEAGYLQVMEILLKLFLPQGMFH